MENEKTKGLIFAFLALFLWGIHGPAGRYLALNNVNMYFVTASRFIMGTAVFFIFLLIRGKIKLNIKKRWKLVLALSIIGLALNSILYHLTLIYLPATLVMILENLSPVFVLTFSLILHKIKPKIIEIFTLLMSFSGVILIVLGKEHFENLHPLFYLGIILGILTGITFGFYVFFSAVLVKPLKNNPDTIIQFLFKIFLIASIIMLPVLIWSADGRPKGFKQWFWLVEMGTMQSGLAYLFWNYALSLLPTNKTSILFLLTILFTTINEIIFLDLKLNIYLIIGGILIITAGYILTKKTKKKRKILKEDIENINS
ncbi:MAG TPA: EamA family transporter [Candidatus Mcinerneyibacterium sp.]|nr:EamA family transporter [Candidatus Mcinerneyibacterium sp.]